MSEIGALTYPKTYIALIQRKDRVDRVDIGSLRYHLPRMNKRRITRYAENHASQNLRIQLDIHGVSYVLLDNANGWKLNLAKELQAAGLSVDMNKLLPNR